MTNDELNGMNSIRLAIDEILYVNCDISKKKRTRVKDKHRDIFINIINSIEYIRTRTNLIASDLDIDLSAYDDKYYNIIDTLFFLKYGKECAELISFYLWERVNPDGSINQMYDSDGNEVILETPLDLWLLLLKADPSIAKK